MAEFTTYMWSVPDWRTDEMHTDLDNREQGIFRNLIDECWVRGSITSDTESLAKFSQEPHEYFLLAWAKMKTKFSPISGGSRLINQRLEEDRARLMRTDKFTVKRAKKAAKTRWDKVRSQRELHAGSIAQASNKHAIKQCQSHSQLREDSSLIDLPNTVSIPPLLVCAPIVAPVTSPFEKFWEVYPKKRSKAQAEKAWQKAKLDSALETILLAVTAQKLWHDWIKDGGQFIPYPATWLNARGWLNQPDEHLGGNGNGRQREGIIQNSRATTFGGGEFTKPYTPRQR